MSDASLASLAEVFSRVPDRRDPRGVRHSIQVVTSLVFLGMLARIREMVVLQRWATQHWQALRDALGSNRDAPPNATTISRALAGCSLAEFRQAFGEWLRHTVASEEPWTASVDGKTACQGLDAQGNPVQLLTVLVHQVKAVVGQWSVGEEKSNEPVVLKRHLAELLEQFPMLRLLTGDAIYAQRPLVEALQAHGCDYLFQIKSNQPDVQDALQTCLGKAERRPPAAETHEKRGLWQIAGGCGSP
jgi:hypothetical protein